MCDLMADDVYETIHGTTDSEHAAGLYFTYLGGFDKAYSLEEMKRALEKTIQTIMQLQKDHLLPADFETRYSSLNFATTDGVQLLTFRCTTGPESDPPSLYISTTAGVTLNRKFPGHPNQEDTRDANRLQSAKDHGSHVIVASEPTTFVEKDWDLIGKNEAVLVTAHGEVSRQPIDIQLL